MFKTNFFYIFKTRHDHNLFLGKKSQLNQFQCIYQPIFTVPTLYCTYLCTYLTVHVPSLPCYLVTYLLVPYGTYGTTYYLKIEPKHVI